MSTIVKFVDRRSKQACLNVKSRNGRLNVQFIFRSFTLNVYSPDDLIQVSI